MLGRCPSLGLVRGRGDYMSNIVGQGGGWTKLQYKDTYFAVVPRVIYILTPRGAVWAVDRGRLLWTVGCCHGCFANTEVLVRISTTFYLSDSP